MSFKAQSQQENRLKIAREAQRKAIDKHTRNKALHKKIIATFSNQEDLVLRRGIVPTKSA